jgi:hypothetical protein
VSRATNLRKGITVLTPASIHVIRRNQRLKHLAASAAVTLMAVLCIVSSSLPAMASSRSSGLPEADGDYTLECPTLGTDGDIQGVLCIELGLYTASTGQKFVTAQVDGWCNNFVNDSALQCSNIVVNATVADGAGYIDWTTHACGHQNGDCQTISTSFSADNYFYPFGGLPITNGSCINNVWVVLNAQGTYITLPGSNKNVYLSSNVEDGHFSQVCLDNGSFSAS